MPLDLLNMKELLVTLGKLYLLTNPGGLGEDLCQLRVQVDHHVFLGLHQFIPLFNLLFYPYPECISDNGVDHIAEP